MGGWAQFSLISPALGRFALLIMAYVLDKKTHARQETWQRALPLVSYVCSFLDKKNGTPWWLRSSRSIVLFDNMLAVSKNTRRMTEQEMKSKVMSMLGKKSAEKRRKQMGEDGYKVFFQKMQAKSRLKKQ